MGLEEVRGYTERRLGLYVSSNLFSHFLSLLGRVTSGWAQGKGEPGSQAASLGPCSSFEDPKRSRKEGQASSHLPQYCSGLTWISDGQNRPFRGNQLEGNQLSGLCLLASPKGPAVVLAWPEGPLSERGLVLVLAEPGRLSRVHFVSEAAEPLPSDP